MQTLRLPTRRMSRGNRQCLRRYTAGAAKFATHLSRAVRISNFTKPPQPDSSSASSTLVKKYPEVVRSYSPDGFPVLALAAAFGHFPIVRYLFEKGGDVTAVATNGTGYNALTGAVTGGHEEIAIWLLENGADANYRYGPGYTPLLAAAANGHLEIVKDLLAHGADIHAKTNDGQTAVTIAEERKHPEVAALLRDRGGV